VWFSIANIRTQFLYYTLNGPPPLVQAVAHSARDRLIESWNDTEQHFQKVNPKRVYYLSMEFLMGEPPHPMHFL
jgi:glucan phosphorylase